MKGSLVNNPILMSSLGLINRFLSSHRLLLWPISDIIIYCGWVKDFAIAWRLPIIIRTGLGRYKMKRNTKRLKLHQQDADRFISAVHSQKRVSGLTHDFYKYPARFSPEFCSAAIDVFTNPGDHVVDPFVGGGTTLVEARAAGRLGVGTDISSLANFVSLTKTRIYSDADFAFVREWVRDLPNKMNIRQSVRTSGDWQENGYLRNLDSKQTWALRKSIELGVMHASKIRDKNRQNLVRCIILRSAQWALDGRNEFPSVAEFRDRVQKNAERALSGALDFRSAARKGDKLTSPVRIHRSVCLQDRASGLAKFMKEKGRACPKLVVTSPPYPGVHILYHRWQVHGGRETPAPFWIANRLDGSGAAYYLMSARQDGLQKYYDGVRESFESIGAIADDQTTVVQLVAFSKPKVQLQRYLDVMDQCGFQEMLLAEHIDSSDGRLWRGVPGRRWHANSKGDLASGKEVVLIHRRK